MNDSTKICSKCKVAKPATNEYFARSKQHPSGLYPSCKLCKSIKDKTIYPTIRDKRITAVKEYAASHKKDKQLYDKKYREINKEIIAYRKKINFEQYKQANPEKVKMQALIQAAKRRANKSKYLSIKDVNNLINRSQGICFYCNTKTSTQNPLELDHIIPLIRGGSHSVGNLVVSCRKCNRSKCHRFVMEWKIGKVVPRKDASANL